MKINSFLWNVGVADSSLRIFKGDTYTERGIIYNSYLRKDGDDYILVGAVPRKYVSEWMKRIGEITTWEHIKRMILLTDRECEDAVLAVLQANPHVVFIASHKTLYELSEILWSAQRVEIRSGRKLKTKNVTLDVQIYYDVKAQDGVYVFDQELKAVFTADVFYSEYAKDRRESLRSVIETIKRYGIELICPDTGPVVDDELDWLLNQYEGSIEDVEAGQTVYILHDGGDFYAKLSDQIAQGIKEAGVEQVIQLDLSQSDREAVIEKAQKAKALIIGTSAEDGENSKAVWDIVTSLKRENCKKKAVSVFYPVKGRWDNVDELRRRLSALGFDMNYQDFFVQGKVTKQVLKDAQNYGFGIGCSIRKVPNPRRPKLVKCLVCGEIFDASLGKCPVCGVGLDQCVPIAEDEILYRNDTVNRYVILGGGIAALSAAEAIRRRDKTGDILMISAEPHLPINRPMLTKDLAQAVNEPESLLIHSLEWYKEKKIRVKLDCRAEKIILEEKSVMLTNGEKVYYDRLILAMGAECFIPPFQGHNKKGVMSIRHISDVKLLKSEMRSATRVTVIGGGVLGLEAASEFLRAGMKVTILEVSPQIIGRQIDRISADRLKHQIESMGAFCYEGVQIESIEGEEHAEGVKLADGRVIPADFVIVSCGNRANINVALDAGITCERAIVVDQYMRTDKEDIYACGDCAQYREMNYQLWQEASEQGKTAGANAAGEKVDYKAALLGLNLEGFGTVLYAIGDPGKKEGIPYHTVEVKDEVRQRYERYWFIGELLYGAVIMGNAGKVPYISQAVTVHASYSEIFAKGE